jgi:CheY-like chemotaxis protein
MARFRALIVDDELQVRHTTARALARCGFECELACNGREALFSVKDGHFDLVVTDLRMPDVNGHRLATELLSLAQRPVIAILTGVEEPKLATDLVARGVDRIFYKPVNCLEFASDLLSIVEQRMLSTTETDVQSRQVVINSLANLHSEEIKLKPESAKQLQPLEVSGNTRDDEPDQMRLHQLFSTGSDVDMPTSSNSASRAAKDLLKVDSEIDVGLSNTFARDIQSELKRTKTVLEELRCSVANLQAISYFNLCIALFSGLLAGVFLGWLGSWYFRG